MKTMKEVLRALRSEKGEKQDTVAKDLMLARGTYSSYENGITPPTEVCIRLAEYYNVSLEYLLGLTNERRPGGGKLADAYISLGKLAGDTAPTSAEAIALIEALIRYYKQGAPCGDAPLTALNGFTRHMAAALDAVTKGDGPAMLDQTNAAAIAALDITKLPALFYQDKEDDSP